MRKKKANIKAEMFIREGENNHLKLVKYFRAKDGTMWYLNPYNTLKWPNGNPCRCLYESLWGGKLVVRLNEIGQLTYAQYA